MGVAEIVELSLAGLGRRRRQSHSDLDEAPSFSMVLRHHLPYLLHALLALS